MPHRLSKEQREAARAQLGDLVQRALVQAADMRDVEEKMETLVAKTSQMTPSPEMPPETPPEAPGESRPPGGDEPFTK